MRVILREMDRRIPVRYYVSWDLSEVPHTFFGSNADLRQLRAMLNNWGDVVFEEAKAFGDKDE